MVDKAGVLKVEFPDQQHRESPGNLFEMQMLRLHPRLLESETGGGGPARHVEASPSGDSDAQAKSRTAEIPRQEHGVWVLVLPLLALWPWASY